MDNYCDNKKLIKYLYEINKLGVWLWMENDNLKFRIPRNIDGAEILNNLKKNKKGIEDIIIENKISTNINNSKFIYKVNSQECELSYAQERLWFIEQFEEGTNAYHMPLVMELEADTEVAGIKFALQQVVTRHEVLRSTIKLSDIEKRGVQLVHKGELMIEEVFVGPSDDFDSIIIGDINKPFNLGSEYPLRVKLYFFKDPLNSLNNKRIILINFHHIVSDGWSLEIFQRELFDYYNAYVNNDFGFRLPELEIQYKDFTIWQRAYLTGEIIEKQIGFWRHKLSGYQTLALPTDYPRPSNINYEGTFETFSIDGKISQQLRDLARKLGVTMHSVLLSSFNILLSKYSGQDDIVTGSPVANRNHLQTEGLIGFFINTLTNRSLLNSSQSFQDLIKQVHQEQVQSQLHQDLPFEKIIEELGVMRDPSRHPVFQVLFVVQSFGNQRNATTKQKTYLKPFGLKDAYEVAKFDLSVYIDDSQYELTGLINYAKSLFRKETISSFIGHYINLLDQLTAATDIPYSQISLLSTREYNQIVYEWNAVEGEYPHNKTIHELFEIQAEKLPENIALIGNGHQLSYRDLNEKSNQLARDIRAKYEQKVKRPLAPDTLIGLFLDRSPEMVIGILAILKAGGAYVPMETNYPQERINYLLEDSGVELILVQRKQNNTVLLPSDKVVFIDLSEPLYLTGERTNLLTFSRSTDLAYIIYTSGTTGKPKGVMQTHGNVMRLFTSTEHQFSFSQNDVWTLFHSYVFDFSVWELWGALNYGGKLVIVTREQTRDTDAFYNLCCENKVTILNQTPSAFYRFAEIAGNSGRQDLSLRSIIFGGEALNVEQLETWWAFQRQYKISAKLINMYGITETTVHVTYKHIDRNEVVKSTIGKPISDLTAYVLDKNLCPVPVGIIGELYIGGAGLARGYLNRSDLTSERFLLNPFVTEREKSKGFTRLYKTGDLVRWLQNGDLEYIGRNDAQVKVRGYRIELGEIEHAILQIKGIKQCRVLQKERTTVSGQSKYLVAYYVAVRNEEAIKYAEINDILTSVLPEFMVPDTYLEIESFPLTVNGKLDSASLPEPDFSNMANEYVGPANLIEAEICNIWQALLGLERVGMTDDFFRIGGNSILAIQLSHMMSKALGFDIKVAGIFKHRTIAQLLRYSVNESFINIPKVDTNQSVLSFAQERLWFIEQYEGGTNAYHIPLLFELDCKTDKAKLTNAIKLIVRRHEILRSTIQQEEGKEHGIQLAGDDDIVIEDIWVTEKEDYSLLINDEINRPFDLSKEYPLRVKYYNIQGGHNGQTNRILILINFHHIASDGWSMEIFERELYLFYNAFANGDQEFNLPSLDIQYRDYARWQRGYLSGQVLAEQISYWKEKLIGSQTLELPTDYPRPLKKDYRGGSRLFSLSREISDRLRDLARTRAVTLHSVMLSSLNILLSKYSGQDDIVTGSPTANRQYHQTESLIGFFVNSISNRTILSNTQTFEELVKQVHQEQIKSQMHQDLPFEKIIEELKVVRDTSRHPVFQVMFAVQRFGFRNKHKDKQEQYIRPFPMAGTYEVEKFDMTVFIDDSEPELTGYISYAASLFKKETIIKLINHFINLLEQLTEAPEKLYSSISLLSAGEYEEIVCHWNATDKEYIKDKTIHKLFEEQATRTPDTIAVVFDGQQLTYRELNERSNQLARHIRATYQQRTNQVLTPDTLIALFLSRSLEMVIGILGILKAGGAYVPVDINYPQERICYLLADSGASLVLTLRHLKGSSINCIPPEKIVCIDLSEKVYITEDSSNIPLDIGFRNLAYVIYTSGTTGNPKGVMIEHQSVINYVNNVNEVLLPQIKNVDFSGNLAFDLTVTTTICALLLGRSVFIYGGELSDIDKYSDHLVVNRIDFIKSTPSFLANIPAEYFNNQRIKLVFTGGEKLEDYHLKHISRYAVQIVDEYGPTETTVGATYAEKSAGAAGIGRAYHNYRLYILDRFLIPVPAGVTGELYIGGAGVARGYLNRPDLTATRFVANTFATAEDKIKGYTRLYRTGDIVRWMQDGQIEYIGRNDDQVKIRGYRIELGEIETAMLQISGIRQSCVIARERKTESGLIRYLTGYYVPYSKATTRNHESIVVELSRLLPEYMIPQSFIQMESFPQTVNGKLDKRAFPDQDFSLVELENKMPESEIEAAICLIWAEVLGMENVGATDDFFRIGGDSILSIQVSGRIRQLGYNCQVRDIFECRSVRRLSDALAKRKSEIEVITEQGLLGGTLHLLPVQQWFIEQVTNGNFAAPNHWNHSFLIRVPSLDTDKLQEVIHEIVIRHDMLRVRFCNDATRAATTWKQEYYLGKSISEIRTLDISRITDNEVQQILTDWQSRFDLEHGPLFQFGYISGYPDSSARIYIAVHHMVMDAVSWRILKEDIKTLYNGKALPPKRSSFRQWVNSVTQYGQQHSDEMTWWESLLRNIPDWPEQKDLKQPAQTLIQLDPELTDLLLHRTSGAYHTDINELLLSAFAFALKEINGSDVQGVTLEGHGREDIDPAVDTSNIVGWFTTMFPVRLEVCGSVRETIIYNKEQLRSLPARGLGFGVFATQKDRKFSNNDLPPVMFNYLGQFDLQEGNWQITAELSGISLDSANIDHHIVSVNGMVRDGRLVFSIITRLGEVSTKQLGDSYLLHLKEVINHCLEKLEQEGTGFTPGDFPTVRLSSVLLDKLSKDAAAEENEIVSVYPATSLQQGFIYHHLSYPEDDAYRVQLLYDYNRRLDTVRYKEAWEYCIARYPILRTAFNWEEELIQITYKKGSLAFMHHDVSHLTDSDDRNKAIDAIQEADRQQRFDLTRPSLLRLHIIKHSEEQYTILKSEHHSIADGWSGPVLLTAVHQYYEALTNGGKLIVKEDIAYLHVQDYIWKNRVNVQAYWEKTLSTSDGANDISALLSEPIDAGSYREVRQPAAITLNISGALYNKLKTFIQQEGITLNVVVQFLWHKMLQVYGGSLQTIAGTTVSGRDIPVEGIEESVGLYINTLPLIIDWNNTNTIQKQLRQIQQRISELNTNSFANLAKLQKNGDRLFHSLFVYENYPIPKGSGKSSDISLRKAIEKIDYPLSITAMEHSDTLVIRFGYDALYLKEEKAEQHLKTLERILQQVLTAVNKPHTEISLLSDKEYERIVYNWNATDKSYPTDKTIHQLFEEQAERTPDNIALVFEGLKLTYRELNEKSNQLARHIRAQYQQKTTKLLEPDTLIALLLDRSLEMVIGILGILKAGAAYVPMDINYPQDRLDYLLQDSKAGFILTKRYLWNEKLMPEKEVIYVGLSEELYYNQDVLNLHRCSNSDNLAYIIYTSGTAGKPKGVMVEHRSLVSYSFGFIDYYGISCKEKFSQIASYVFDTFGCETWPCLASGSELYITSNGFLLDSGKHKELINSGVTIVDLPTSITMDFIASVLESKSCNIKLIKTGGEKLNRNPLDHSSIAVVNTYGPTETTIGSIATNPNEKLSSFDSIPIGKPLYNEKAYVLDQHMCPVPVGVTGELYIGGAGLARGYLNRPDLTFQRFVINPFATKSDMENGYTRMYKTGDLVRWLPDGNLEFIGRNDEQVKIRGYRIELGEIESTLMQIRGIQQCCVLARERATEAGTSRYLVGYYISQPGIIPLSQDYLISELSGMLPEYMVPAAFVAMQSFPLTVNGKLDKKALPDPVFDMPSDEDSGPVTHIESALCKVWQEVLGLKRVNLTDDFFRIGGDSILSIQASGRIRQLGYNCHVRDIFECKTVRDLSSLLISRSSEILIKTEKGLLSGTFGLLPVQEWFADRVVRGEFTMPGYWNQSFLIRVPQLNQKKLLAIILELVSYHDMLRIGFRKGKDGEYARWLQNYNTEISEPQLRTLDIAGYHDTEIQQVLTNWQNGFDLENGPLFQFGYIFGYSDRSARLFVAAHHMVIDSVSWRILTEDIKSLYNGKPLPPKASSYRQWVSATEKYAQLHLDEVAFWAEQLSTSQSFASSVMKKDQHWKDFEISMELTRELIQNAPSAYHTEVNDLLLTALAYALKDISAQSACSITLEGHGREDIDPSLDISHTIGWFTTMFPVKLQVWGSIAESIRYIKEHLRSIPFKGFGFGALANRNLHGFSYSDLPPVCFNYLGQMDLQEGDWQITGERSGMNTLPANTDNNLININGLISGGQLHFDIVTRLGEESTRQLCHSFRYHLEEVIRHCTWKLDEAGSSYTPSDFMTVKISQSLLDKLSSKIK